MGRAGPYISMRAPDTTGVVPNGSHYRDSLLGMTPMIFDGSDANVWANSSQTTSPHGKGGRYKGTDRPNEGSITLWDHRSRPGYAGETSAVD